MTAAPWVSPIDEVTPTSYENKVDQLWCAIFQHYFPYSEQFLVVPRERLNGPQAPDITVKYLHNNKSYTILTMENKRASGWHLGSSWKSALTELDEYLDLIPESAKPNPTFQVGMVGIGLFVRFYCRRNGGATEDYPRSGGEMLHVKRDARKIQRLLKGIKERTADWLVVNV